MIGSNEQRGLGELQILLSDVLCDALVLTINKASTATSGSVHFFLSFEADYSNGPADAYFGLQDLANASHLLPPQRIFDGRMFAFELPESNNFLLQIDFSKETLILRFGYWSDSGLAQPPVSFGEGQLLYRTGKRVEFNAPTSLPADPVARTELLARPGHSPTTKAAVALELLKADNGEAPSDERNYAVLLSYVLFDQLLTNDNWLGTDGLVKYQDFLCAPARIEMLMEELNKRSAERPMFGALPQVSFVISKHSINPSWLLARAPQYLRALDFVMEFAQGRGVPCYLAYGTLLGALRNNSFIPHDDDVDVIVDLGASTSEEMEERLSELGASLTASGVKLRATGPGISHLQAETPFGAVDIFSFWVEDGRAYLAMEKYEFRDIDATILTGGKPDRAWLYEMEYPAPPKPHEFMRERYGADWMTPNPYHEWPWPLRLPSQTQTKLAAQRRRGAAGQPRVKGALSDSESDEPTDDPLEGSSDKPTNEQTDGPFPAPNAAQAFPQLAAMPAEATALRLEPGAAKAALLSAAQEARLAGDRALAADRMRAALAEDPADLRIMSALAWELIELNRIDEAEAVCNEAMALAPAEVDILLRLGIIARRRGDRAGAADRFSTVLQHHPAHPAASLELAWDLLHLGALDKAEAVCRALLASHPRNAQAQLRLGLVARARGDLPAALHHFEAALDIEPGDAWAKQELDRTRVTLEARPAATPASRAPPNPPVPMTKAALLEALAEARRGGDQREVLDRLRALLALDPGDARVHADLAWALIQADCLDEADSVCRAALARFPEDAELLVRHGILARCQGDRVTAIARCRAALEQRPAHGWASLELAANLTETGQLDAAEAVCRALIAAEPGNAQAHVRVGIVQRRRGELEDAVASFTAATRLDTADRWAPLQLAVVLGELDRTAEAIDVLDGLLAADPRNVRALRQLGLARRQLGDGAGACEAFAAALELEPGSVPIMIELSREERALGHAAKADQWLDMALEREPGAIGTLLELIQLRSQEGDTPGALALCRRAIEAHPAEAWLHAMLCRLLSDIGETEEAAAALTAALSRFGPDATLVDRQMLQLRQRGEPQAARAALRALPAGTLRSDFALWSHDRELDLQLGDLPAAMAALQDPPPHRRKWEQAQLHTLRGRIASAGWDLKTSEEAFAAAAAVPPGDPQAHKELARLALLRFDLPMARAELKRSMAATARAERRPEPRNIGPTFHGQLLHEFELDPTLAEELRRLREEAPPDRIERLRRLVAAHPHQTPGAIGLLVELRLSGLLRIMPADGAEGAGEARRIPRRIAQFWAQGKPDADLLPLMRSWAEAHPDHAYRCFDRKSGLMFLTASCAPDVAAAFEGVSEPAQAADILRLAWLAVEGGIWADADDRCRAPLSGMIAPETTFLAYQEDFGSIGNNVLAVAPGHPVVIAALRDAVAAVLRGDRDMIWLSTGPGLLTRAFARYLAEQPVRTEVALRGMSIATRIEMQRCVAMFCAAAYKQKIGSWTRRASGQ